MRDKDGHDDGDEYDPPRRFSMLDALGMARPVMLTDRQSAVIRANVALMRDEDVRRRDDEKAARDASF